MALKANPSTSFFALFLLVAFVALVLVRVLVVGNSLSDTAEYGAEGIQKLNELNAELEQPTP